MVTTCPSPASTVVLLRNGGRAGAPEVLLLQRRRTASWLGGAWVFPGGRVDDGDRDPAWEDLCTGVVALHDAWPAADAAWLRDHAVAAVREVFEETGVLLATGTAARPMPASRIPVPVRASAGARRRLLAGLESFASLCARHGWVADLGALLPFSRWITPEQERRRFDTLFFLAVAPTAPVERHEGELTAHLWLTAADAVDRYERGDIDLSPPTLRTLEDLAAHDSLEATVAWARAVPRRVIAPRFHVDAQGQWLLLPGDPAYPRTDVPPVPAPTRFEWRAGRWHSAR